MGSNSLRGSKLCNNSLSSRLFLSNSLSTHDSLPQLHRGLFHNSSQLLFLSELFQDLHLSHKELFHNNSNLLLFQKFQSQRLLLEKMVRMVDMSMILLEMPPSADLSCSSRGRLLKLQDKQHYNSFVIGLI